MNSLPSGTVTFLFTDIEGSTRLWQEQPEAMAIAHARHDEILRTAIESNHGYVFQIVGDSFSAAFHNAIDGLRAVLAAQRALYQTQTSEFLPTGRFAKNSEVLNSEVLTIRVRMGLHTGTAEILPDGKYEGYATLALTQRIMSAGHGGQILISQSTYDLTRDRLPENVKFIDMGERRLKDVLRTERLYQLCVPDLPSEFAPLNTLETFTHNLPTQLTSFIGREKEIDEIKQALTTSTGSVQRPNPSPKGRGETRLVTLTGSGGAGKTRLSLQVGTECLQQFSEGVWFVELAPVTDPTLIAQTLLSIFNLREDSQRTALEVLTDYLRTKTLLLMLDNCEHLIEACAQISEYLLRACPKIKILASSREALGIAGEVSYRVPSLATPNLEHLPSLEQLSELDSIRLFIERAATAKPDFTLTKDNASFVAQICFRLDGIPLALELAAARVRMLSPEQIASRLDDRFRLLTGGSRTALPRQQTLRAMIDWSYSLLSEPEKMLFRRLAVFVGGWMIEAAESICGEERGGVDVLDLLTRLVDKSLVYIEEFKGEIQYHRLETIRQYSREKFFETDEVETIRDRHLAFYVQYAESAEEHMRGRRRVEWTQRLAAEEDNLRTAMEWGLGRNPESALRIAASLPIYWLSGGVSAEGFRWIQRAIVENMENIGTVEQPILRAKGLGGLAFLYMSLGDFLNGKRVAEESVALFRRSQDQSGLAYALVILSFPFDFLGEFLQAETALLESVAIARSEKNAFVLASALNYLTRVTLELHGDMDAAERYADEAIRLSQEAGIEWAVAMAHEMKGRIAISRKEYAEARTWMDKALQAYQETGAWFNVIVAKSELAHMERELGNYAIALDIYHETIVAFRDVGHIGAVAHQLECFGFIALTQNQIERALRLFAVATTLREKGGTPMSPDGQVYFDEQLKGLRDKLGKIQFDSIWSKGCAMAMEQAVRFALELGVGD